jgi:hypothetical protein
MAGPIGGLLVEKLRAKLNEPPETPSPPFFPLPELPDATSILARLKEPMDFGALAFTPDIGPMPTIPPALVTPTSVFPGMRKALEQELGQEPGAALKAAHAQEQRLREFLFVVVARQLPEKTRPQFDKLKTVFDALDQALAPMEPEPTARRFPVRALPEDGRVRPVVGRLTVRARGASESALREWLPLLHSALGKQSYLKVA